MREILVHGKHGGSALVDDDDFEWLSQYRWFGDTQGYVLTSVQGKPLRMHRMLMEAKPGQVVDHWDRNPRNNQRANLRLCTHRQNMQNRGPVRLWSKAGRWLRSLTKTA